MNVKSEVAEKKETKAKMTMAVKVKRYEVQFQKDCHHHSDTNSLAQAKYYAYALANWNLAAQVYDRATQTIVFRARAYAEKKLFGLIHDLANQSEREGQGNLNANPDQHKAMQVIESI